MQRAVVRGGDAQEAAVTIVLIAVKQAMDGRMALLPLVRRRLAAVEEPVQRGGINLEEGVFADVALDDLEHVGRDVLGLGPVLFIPLLQLAHVAGGADLDVQFDVLREAGDGENAGADEGDGADDLHARVGDVSLGMELSLRVGAALDSAGAEGLARWRRCR